MWLFNDVELREWVPEEEWIEEYKSSVLQWESEQQRTIPDIDLHLPVASGFAGAEKQRVQQIRRADEHLPDSGSGVQEGGSGVHVQPDKAEDGLRGAGGLPALAPVRVGFQAQSQDRQVRDPGHPVQTGGGRDRRWRRPVSRLGRKHRGGRRRRLSRGRLR